MASEPSKIIGLPPTAPAIEDTRAVQRLHEPEQYGELVTDAVAEPIEPADASHTPVAATPVASDAVAATPVGAAPVASDAVASDAVASDAMDAYTLRFDIGLVETVTGSGLLGRRPVAQPGEVFDHFVAIDDPSRTVSKTHLQFGIDDGELWVCDRYSANGSGVITSESGLRACEPGARYRVPRGAQVQVGERVFFVE